MIKIDIRQINIFSICQFLLSHITLVLVLFVFLLLSDNAIAQENKDSSLSLKQLLLMPGKLTAPHAKIESDCQKCHLHFDKENQTPLCLDCHEEIKSDLDTSKGFHSKIEIEKIKQCQLCHTDHKGRNVDITSLDKDYFDHNNTEFSLKHSHAQFECADCHKKTDKNFRIKLKEGQCISCHDDPHKGQLTNKCTQCHDEKNWLKTTFDHNKTDFILKDKHQNLACNTCHVNDVAVEIGTECINCHLSNDKHLNTFGSKCQSCHSEKGWEKTDYDHFKETKFRLLGEHKSLTCDTCHKTTDMPYHVQRKKLGKTCFDCHQKDDIHLANNGKECQQCHNNNDWSKTSFDHDKETSFMLKGTHKTLSCDACHIPILDNLKKTTNHSIKTTKLKEARVCFDCHESIDSHDGNLGKQCQSCHRENKWHEQLLFNHDFTSFPLTGSHQLQVCQRCHSSNDYVVEKLTCVSCHQADDLHQNSFGNKCENCHNSASWSTWLFDHQKQTDYPLEGAHNNLACDLCHQPSPEEVISPPKQCESCHQKDDVHQGSFGKNCQKCHNSDSFYDFKH